MTKKEEEKTPHGQQACLLRFEQHYLLGLIFYEAPNRQQNLYEVRCADIFTITDPN